MAEAIAPPPKLTVSEWAEKYRIVSGKAAAMPGKWRNINAPHLVEIMDAVSDPDIHTVTYMAGTQDGKTEVALNAVGYLVHCRPGPIALVYPNRDTARDVSRTRLAPMIRDCEPLRERFADPKSRDSDNTTLSKGFVGGHLYLLSADSPRDLAARPVRDVINDETDRYEDNKEGDPLGLVEKRQTRFWNSFTFNISSPGDDETSRIKKLFGKGDGRQWYVPCPHCGKHQILVWKNVRWDKKRDVDGNLILDEDSQLIHLPETAYYACEHCGATWTEAERQVAILAGHWRKERPTNGHASFYRSGIANDARTMAKIVGEFVDAQGVPGQLKVFVNTVLAETWKDTGEKVSDDELVRRAEQTDYVGGYSSDIKLPRKILTLTAFTDTQGDRLELAVMGWGLRYQHWLVVHRVLAGDPSDPDLLEELGQQLALTWETEDGRLLPIRAAGIDAGGHFWDQILNWCAKRWGRRIWAMKGKARGVSEPVWSRTYSKSKSRASRNKKFWIHNVDAAKAAVKGFLEKPEPGPGYFHIPKGTPAEFLKQYSAEELRTKYKDGFPVKKWHTWPHRRNEALDLHAGNYSVLCGLESMGFDLNREAARVANAPPPDERKKQTATAPPATGGVSVSGNQPGFTPMADPWASNNW